jgi:hypothetical protein
MPGFQTYFGVPVPVFRIEKLGAGAFTIRFVLKGRIASKKNNMQAVARRREAKEFLYNTQRDKGLITLADALRAVDMVQPKMVGNIDYRRFLERFKPVIRGQMDVWEARLGEKGLKFPLRKVALSMRLYFADQYITDTLNKQQSVHDLLVECGVIVDDDRLTVNPYKGESMSCFQKIKENICFISLSFKIEEVKNDEKDKIK